MNNNPKANKLLLLTSSDCDTRAKPAKEGVEGEGGRKFTIQL